MNIPTINLARTGTNIVMLRKAAGLTVHDLQMAFGFNSPQAIYKWQNGTALPTMLRMVSSLQKTAIFNHKLNDKPKELWYSTVRNQEQISTERTQNYEDYFFRYLLYERMAGYLPVRGI